MNMNQQVFHMSLRDAAARVIWADDVFIQTETPHPTTESLLKQLGALGIQQSAPDEWVDQFGWHYHVRQAKPGEIDGFSAPRPLVNLSLEGLDVSSYGDYHLYNKPSASFDGVEDLCETPLCITPNEHTEYAKVARVSMSKTLLESCLQLVNHVCPSVSLFINRKDEFMISFYALRHSWGERESKGTSLAELCLSEILNELVEVECGGRWTVYVAFVEQDSPKATLFDIQVDTGLVLSTCNLPIVDIEHLCMSSHWVRDEGVAANIMETMNDPMLTPAARRILSAVSTMKAPDHQPVTYIVFDVDSDGVPGLPYFEW